MCTAVLIAAGKQRHTNGHPPPPSPPLWFKHTRNVPTLLWAVCPDLKAPCTQMLFFFFEDWIPLGLARRAFFSFTSYQFTPVIFSSVFTRRGLEKIPTYAVPAMETFQMNRPGADSDRLTQEDEEDLERITQRMRRKLIEQRILSKPCFQDFDK